LPEGEKKKKNIRYKEIQAPQSSSPSFSCSSIQYSFLLPPRFSHRLPRYLDQIKRRFKKIDKLSAYNFLFLPPKIERQEDKLTNLPDMLSGFQIGHKMGRNKSILKRGKILSLTRFP
jgi:hypothetical protein